ncbi:MAG: bifunctional glutamate N-acetyltransferase/amino-acid acetyltransferase ArgJ [SAR202 cluster bacterium]|jgi:glutamate N-acetyltransferase/amino-acid N-acetyltransferase|nr:bifunctional glutamate N-acetyltransferase/amino-acid acetyltransferase ArgJ [SAR202 cluster bacterium]MDP7223945.1 bifunctional glutamate N-acetyltransferase/amino-acid acetyltransferase ArgJ [SAR202 cluster bacterium]MDP7413199.1 bifunctional glutamate N-acetyltransferase/amino-acid acetyltransferase ArgJ [SAR202 cluster bacterium]MDP7532980.1 bifunctional glutamate N-acetyltransferase/amino-acid acetyltransferase ArgJ [SAR202 cluster bacterium]HJO82203.1 bifunctional glutamate N-acetyltra
MADNVEFIPDGNVTSSKRYRAGGTYAGLKSQGDDVRDIGMMVSDSPASVAGTFSRNKVLSPSVTVTKEKSANGSARGVIANSGCANCAVGAQGYTDAMEMSELAAKHAGVDPAEMLIGSTGMIGIELPMALVRQAVPAIELTDDGGDDFARSIMTTDSRPKSAAVSFTAGGVQSTIGGAAKGVGMIHPDMATMLCFLSCDANVEASFLQTALSEAVGLSFNMIDIDGDQSTNDTVLLFANAAAGGSQITAGSESAAVFQEALNEICIHLAKELVRDGEGAERIFAVTVDGAASVDDARVGAREIAASNLVKAMVHGRDPNWGRIMMALGKSGIHIDESKIDIYINGIHIVHDGIAIPYSTDAVIAGMRAPEISFQVSVGVGDASATGWGCDLTEDYVTFNSAYST